MKEKMIMSDENVLRMYRNILRNGNVSDETKHQMVVGLTQLIKGKEHRVSRVRPQAEWLLEQILNQK